MCQLNEWTIIQNMMTFLILVFQSNAVEWHWIFEVTNEWTKIQNKMTKEKADAKKTIVFFTLQFLKFSLPHISFSLPVVNYSLHPLPNFLYLPYSTPIRARFLLRSYTYPFDSMNALCNWPIPAHPPPHPARHPTPPCPPPQPHPALLSPLYLWVVVPCRAPCRLLADRTTLWEQRETRRGGSTARERSQFCVRGAWARRGRLLGAAWEGRGSGMGAASMLRERGVSRDCRQRCHQHCIGGVVAAWEGHQHGMGGVIWRGVTAAWN